LLLQMQSLLLRVLKKRKMSDPLVPVSHFSGELWAGRLTTANFGQETG
jgi:hypothetical protein